MLAVVVAHSAQKGGRVARLQEQFGKAIDLRVKDIVIDGRQNTPEPLLRAALGVSMGDPILGFSVDGARQRIETLSWVDHVAVERRLPGTIYVALTERRPFAIWQNQKKFQLIDRNGEVVANEDVAAFSDLPLVVGAGAPEHAAELLDALTDAPDLRSRGRGQRCASVSAGGTFICITASPSCFPRGTNRRAIARLTDLQLKQSLLDRPLEIVDMRLPDRLAVRAKTPGPDQIIQTPAAPGAQPAPTPPHAPETQHDNAEQEGQRERSVATRAIHAAHRRCRPIRRRSRAIFAQARSACWISAAPRSPA